MNNSSMPLKITSLIFPRGTCAGVVNLKCGMYEEVRTPHSTPVWASMTEFSIESGDLGLGVVVVVVVVVVVEVVVKVVLRLPVVLRRSNCELLLGSLSRKPSNRQ